MHRMDILAPRVPIYKHPTVGRHPAVEQELRAILLEAERKDPWPHKLTEADIPHLRDQWFIRYEDIMQGAPESLPPLRPINHKIPLINEDKRYTYYMPRCPDALKPSLAEKIERYHKAGWWEPVLTDQAAPMLCIPKKNGSLRTVVDGRQQNENTIQDVMPLPDQDQIRQDVARAQYRSKIDLADAYEQIRVDPGDVWKTAFATIYGTNVSHVLQQGDRNGPSTFQRIMTMMFAENISVFVHAYLDDIFVYSYEIEEHEAHLGIVFAKLRAHHFYLKPEKCQLYADSIDCLGHIIDSRGIHADADKMHRIRDWKKPRNYNDVQKFQGLVQYLSHFLPDISSYTTPLLSMTAGGNAFIWRPLHDKCFQMIKHICCTTPILVPVNPVLDIPIWVICDASVSGIGAMYGQGPDWRHCRPAGLMSRKFTDAQRHYRTYEHETIAILQALLKWEDKLIGYRIHVVSDHESLKFMHTQRHLSSRQVRWMEFLSRFDFDVTFVQGVTNKVADVLSRYFETDDWTDVVSAHDYVDADVRLDPHHEDLTWERHLELERNDVVELPLQATERALQLAHDGNIAAMFDHTVVERLTAITTAPHMYDTTVDPYTDDLTVTQSIGRYNNALEIAKLDEQFREEVRQAYAGDKLFSKILQHPSSHPAFTLDEKLIWTHNLSKDKVLCVPTVKKGLRLLQGTIVEQAHQTVGHFGPQQMTDYIRRWYWWPKLYPLVVKFCASCDVCQKTKDDNSRPQGLLHSLPIPVRPWQSIGMDFIGPFPEVDGFDMLWVVICWMTSEVHLIPVNTRRS